MAAPLDKEAEMQARRRRRSVVLGLMLAGLVILFYVLTIAKMGPTILQRPL